MNPLIAPTLPPLAVEAEPEIGWNIFFYSGILFVIALGFAFLARKGIGLRVFTSLPTRLGEHLILFLEGMATGILGPLGRKYVPFLVALWLYIFVGNVMGLVFQFTPTAEWSLNLGLAFLTMSYVQYEGVKANGLWGHIKHFAGPKTPGIMGIAIGGMLFVIEIISECMKVFSLSIRLFGNIHGGHIVVSSLNSILPGVPFGGALLPIKLFTCVIQAYVWTILTCTYLMVAIPHAHDHEETHAAPRLDALEPAASH